MTRNPGRSRRNHRFLLMFLDALVLVAGLTALYIWRVGAVGSELWSRPGPWIFVGTLLILVYIFGGYELESFQRGRDSFTRLGLATSVFTLFGTLVVYLGLDERAGLLGRGVLLGSLFGFFVVGGLNRWIYFQSLVHLQRRSVWVFVVSSRWMERLKQDLASVRFPGKLFFVDERSMATLPQASIQERVAYVVGLERQVFDQHRDLFEQLLQSRVEGHTVLDLTAFYERYWMKIPVQVIAPEWLVQADGFSLFQTPAGLKFKRLFDLFLSFLLLILTFPLMLLAALAIRLESRGPILFRQIRTGRNGEPFTIYKFRSMRVDAEKDGAQWAKVGDTRITRVGNFLRKSRIDELPQILNVLRGDMSFIGPRPERPEFNETLEKEIPYYQLRHLVNPGITGWAQILYPYGASVEDAWEKLQYDLYYIKNYSFWLDVRIALKTARIMILGRGR